MFARISDFYKSRNRRERIMMLAIVLAFGIFWLSALANKNSELNFEKESLGRRLELAQNVMAQAPNIQAELDRISSVIDMSKTFAALPLQTAVEKCARESQAGAYTLSQTSTRNAGNFRLHTINVTFSKNDLKSYAAFENAVAALEPYITISRVVFDGDGQGGVSARYSVSSFEMIK